MALKCYAMESMAYMTAGILDTYEKPDAAVEAAMVKVRQMIVKLCSPFLCFYFDKLHYSIAQRIL